MQTIEICDLKEIAYLACLKIPYIKIYKDNSNRTVFVYEKNQQYIEGKTKFEQDEFYQRFSQVFSKLKFLVHHPETDLKFKREI